MQRISITPRNDWQQRVTDYGLTFHTIDGETYWDESCYYQFSSQEIDLLDDVTNELHRMCLKAVEYVIRQQAFAPFCIPDEFIPLIISSWERAQQSVYGRFDFAFDGTGQPKMLEYNADTPTALLEASVIQWFWLQDVRPEADQFNSIHERLLDRWQEIRVALDWADNQTLYFAAVANNEEDYITVNYLRDVAMQAGFTTEYLDMEQIGWNMQQRRLIDLNEQPIARIFKLYPWEWMVHEEFGQYLLKEPARFFEPAWKMLLSNKAILPVLWHLFPDHPNLLRAEWEPFSATYVKKPILSREGANIAIIRDGRMQLETPGSYTDCPCVYQELSPLPCFANNYPVIGSWVIGDTACGIGIREDNTPITHNTSRFVPHLFLPS